MADHWMMMMLLLLLLLLGLERQKPRFGKS